VSLRFSEEWYAEHQAKQGKDAFQQVIDKAGFNPKEEVDHMAVAQYLNTLGLFWLHIPNEGKRKASTGAKLKRLGLLGGAADIIIFDAPPLHPCAKGVALELKRTKGGSTSEDQEKFLEKMGNRGWITHVAHGANAALDFLRGLGWRIETV
jgi:hypothetical protein